MKGNLLMFIKSKIKNTKSLILGGLCVLLASGCVLKGAVDNNSEQSSSSLPATIYNVYTQSDYDAIKQRVFNGGDQILFARGSNFEGEFSLKRSQVRPLANITVADFGQSEASRPIISADAHDMGTIDIRDSGGWVIKNLELINKSSIRSRRSGIYVMARDSGKHAHFIIKNNFIHDVTGSNETWDNGGIVFRVYGNKIPTTFDDILIENNDIRDIGGVGMRFKSPWEADADDPREVLRPIGRHAITRLVVRGNRVSNTSRNAIIIASADAPLAEYNVLGPKISTETTGNTLYIYSSDDAIVQFNEAFGNHGPAADKDRGGYDADWNSRNITFRYNYSHDNNYAFAIMRRYIDGVRFHHNVSVNERFGFLHYGFAGDNSISDIIVSNNTFYSTNKNMQMFMNFGRTRNPIETTFVDNIFVFTQGDAKWGSEPTTARGNVFENNVVIGLDEPGYNKASVKVNFVKPGKEVTGSDLAVFKYLNGYQLCVGSPAIGKGRTGDNEAVKDFWGDNITSNNIGAYEGPGINCQLK